LRILGVKILPIPHELNFTPSTLGCYGLISHIKAYNVYVKDLGGKTNIIRSGLQLRKMILQVFRTKRALVWNDIHSEREALCVEPLHGGFQDKRTPS